MSFLALDGEKANIVRIDSQGHVALEPIDFLKGEAILGWAVAGLDQLVICEKAKDGEDQLVFKYYLHQSLVRTLQMAAVRFKEGVLAPAWMLLIPEKNCLIMHLMGGNFETKVDLKTGEQKELAPATKRANQVADEIIKNPLWDSKQGNLLVMVAERTPEDAQLRNYLARMDLDDGSLKEEVSPVPSTGIVDLLDYESDKNNLIFYGVYGGIMIHTGTKGFYSIPVDTGKPELLMAKPEGFPDFLNSSSNIAFINKRYVIATRGTPVALSSVETDVHTYLADLKTNGAQVLDTTPLTWPITQAGLHVDSSPAANSPAPSAKTN